MIKKRKKKLTDDRYTRRKDFYLQKYNKNTNEPNFIFCLVFLFLFFFFLMNCKYDLCYKKKKLSVRFVGVKMKGACFFFITKGKTKGVLCIYTIERKEMKK